MLRTGALLVLTALPGCSRPAGNAADTAMPSRTIDEVIAAHTDSLMALPGVVGTAVADCAGTPCIRVLVRSLTPALAARLPRQLDGYQVDVQVTGEFRPR